MSFFTVTRTIHPIGHGAFYTEKIETEEIEHDRKKCHIVYDCGSKSKKLIEEEIDNTFQKGEEILAVFISHLDADHVNGLEHLMQRCCVKYVFLPLLTKDEKWVLMLEDENKNIWDLIMNPRETISGFSAYDPPIIIEISPVMSQEPDWFADEDSPAMDENVDPYEEDGSFRIYPEKGVIKRAKTIRSGTCIRISGVNDWVYIPYNINQKTFMPDIIKQLQKLGFEEYSPEMYPTLSPDEQKNVRKVLSDVIKSNKNKNSMTLYSGSSRLGRRYRRYHVIFECDRGCIIEHRYLNGCLYLGDFELSEDSTPKLADYYQKYCENVLVVQVPHHGSKDNFHESILVEFPHSQIYFISAPENDKGEHHPSGEVLRMLLRNNRFVKHVSEAKESRFQMSIDIYIP